MTVIIAACLVHLGVNEARSCSVPVFRYALERWTPDMYPAVVIFQNEMTEKEQALYQQLKMAAHHPEGPLNLQIQEVHTASYSEKKLKELLKGQIPEKLPALAIWYPNTFGKTAPFWINTLTPSIVEAVTGSPKRKHLAERLIKGDSGVFIFIPSGNSEKDDQVRTFIRQELDSALDDLQKKPACVIPGTEGKQLTYGFSIIPLSPSETEEHFLLDMLLHSEPDLHEHTNEPMVFPIFGRGRLLGALFGEYISTENIQGVVSFITGACSCQVKALNPGTDLLMAAPWNKAIMDAYSPETPLPELTGVMPEVPDTVKQGPVDSNDNKKKIGVLASYGITLGAGVGIVVLLTFILNRRGKKK